MEYPSSAMPVFRPDMGNQVQKGKDRTTPFCLLHEVFPTPLTADGKSGLTITHPLDFYPGIASAMQSDHILI